MPVSYNMQVSYNPVFNTNICSFQPSSHLRKVT